MLTPRRSLLLPSIRNTYIDCWSAHYSEERWIEQQRAGWKIVKVRVSLASEDPLSVSDVWANNTSKKK
jgi:hypothetical protein